MAGENAVLDWKGPFGRRGNERTTNEERVFSSEIKFGN
jgi:hypothetical protein